MIATANAPDDRKFAIGSCMDRIHTNRIAAVTPLIFSGLAFAVVMANIVAGVPPQPDEYASAHVWQLLMGAQLPLILLFALTANWHRRATAFLLAAQLIAIVIACLPVWLAGY